ncbi:uncharacterized protein HMPREF1541_02386 [Cyphellophora europaea CBS 101466]|uniref:Protein KTI12 n=1 Tax=Cyphellophora europaea (strain CBS 101466) TaxID=1220924 RepID=W2S3G3_CYPE1|nr:uncharacterized protein HMPREF1541_02386 [Cyphellophora europaea CBS 101466]ETN43227.1 hypothetical protein HMPREF1541_02386 [Cyphellophora europaea CBS 101466]
MPLIIITGLPSSGKTYRAQQIANYVSQRIHDDAASKRTVQVVDSHHARNDTSCDPSNVEANRRRDEVFNSAAREKTARAEEFSAIKRGVSRDTVVIADCPNYIKGYRYQLWCEAKAAGTRCCVVHVAAQEDECRQWNEARLRSWGRGDEIGQESHTEKGDMTQHGKDVMGNLQPEGHTAVYGDRVLHQIPHSRSSSTDGASNDHDRPQLQDDTMTLKSLYITSPKAPLNAPSNAAAIPPSNTTTVVASDTKAYLPSIPIPRPEATPPYSPPTHLSLSMRYEPPSPFSRWDTPLFTVPTSDTHPPYPAIWDAVFPPPSKPTSRKALSQLSASSRDVVSSTNNSTGTGIDPSSFSSSTTKQDHNSAAADDDTVKPHAATILPQATAASALQTLEATTLQVVRALLAAARTQGAADGDGGSVTFSVEFGPPAPASTSPAQVSLSTVSASEEMSVTIPPGTVLSQPLLQRLRRKYTQLQRGRIAHGQGYVGQRGGRAEVVDGFVRFLGAEFVDGEE